MINKASTLIFLLLVYSSIKAQTIKGTVIDADTKQVLAGANVELSPVQKIVKTNENGNFKIVGLESGRYALKISFVGYETAIIKEILLIAGKEMDLNIQLLEDIKNLEEVSIKPQKEYGLAQNEMATVSAKSFTVEQTKRYAASWGDPARMALSFAGVSNNNDQTNEIIIRGNSPKGMLWKIEGVEVANPNHFGTDGASGGGFSGISTNVLANSDFYTGAFPAEYGNALSGVFDIRLRNGNNEKKEYSFQAGLQGVEASVEGPFSKNSKASYLFNYRVFTVGLFAKLGYKPAGALALPFFQDLAFKLNFPRKKSVISLWGIGGKSDSNYKESSNYTDIEESHFFASGLNILNNLNERSYWENSLSVSGNIVNTQFLRQYYNEKNINSYINFRYNSQYNLKLNPKNTLRLGAIISQLGYDVLDKTENQASSFSRYDDSGNAQLLQTYGQWKYRLSSNFNINAGLHYTYFLLNKTQSLEPRIGGKWQTSPKNIFSFGFGRHSKLHPLPFYLMNFVFNDTLKFKNDLLEIPKANHFVIGYEYRPNSKWKIGAEAYLQNLYQQGVATRNYDGFSASYSTLNDMDTFVNLFLNSKGKGKNVGVELTAERYLTDGFYLLNTTSLFKATYQGSDNIERVARFSNGFVENFLVGKEWKVGRKNKHILGLNLRTTWAGGLRTTPILLEKSLKENYVAFDYSRAYQEKLPNFFRTDFRISYIKNKQKRSSTLSLDLNNISNRSNPKRQYVDFQTKQLVNANQLGLIPVISYRIDF